MANQSTVFNEYVDYNTSIYNVNAGSAYAFNLPANPLLNQIAIVKDYAGSAATNNITVTPPSGVLIDGSSTYVMNTNYQAVTLVFNGFNWETI